MIGSFLFATAAFAGAQAFDAQAMPKVASDIAAACGAAPALAVRWSAFGEGPLTVEYLWVKGEPAPDASYVGAEIAARLRGADAEAP